jgi:hypothetical protein
MTLKISKQIVQTITGSLVGSGKKEIAVHTQKNVEQIEGAL